MFIGFPRFRERRRLAGTMTCARRANRGWHLALSIRAKMLDAAQGSH
jgi:hypothetical protein